MKKQSKLAVAIALALATGSWPIVAAQSAADFQDAEYYASTGLDLINAAEAYTLGYTGKGVTLGVVDQPANFLNPEFSTKTASQVFNTAIMDGGLPNVYKWKLVEHGTHVAGIAAASRNGNGMQGVAYDAEVASISLWSVYDASKEGVLAVYSDYFSYYLTHPEIKVINNSWGGKTYLDQIGLDEDSYSQYAKVFQDGKVADFSQIVLAAKQNKLVVFASGNDGHDTPSMESLYDYWDAAAAKNILTVTALDASNMRTNGKIVENQTNSNLMAFFSNLAKYVEDSTVAAPGYNILSANSNYAADGKLDILMSGTSMAAPFVTGAGAVVQQAFPYLSAKQIGDVLLSTANDTIEYPRGIVSQIQEDTDNNTSKYQLNLFILDSSLNSLAKEELLKKYEDYLANRVTDGWEKGIKRRIDAWKKQGSLINVYYNVPLQEIVGQGVLDVGAAVKGPGALNARRLSSSDISSSYTVNGTNQQQALYNVDTQGYDSVWSNDIKEIKAGYIASDSTEADLQARWKYYDTNWLSYTGTDDRMAATVTTECMMDIYNQRVKESGLAGLSVGLYKAGDGTLTLTGTNTYAGSSIASGGTLAIDGSVAGDAWSVKNTAAGTTGTISGSGTIKGNLYNHGITQPSTAGNLIINGALNSDGAIGVTTAADGQSSRQLVVGGAANINGSTLQSVTGTSYLPDKSYTFLNAAGGITGSLTNTTGSAFSGLLNVKNLTVSGTSGAVTLGIGNNIGSLNADQQWGYDNLPTLLANTQGDSTKQAQLGYLLGASPAVASAGLASATQANSPDGAALTMSSLTAMNAIGARTMYLSTTGSTLVGGASPVRSTENVTTQSSIIPIDLGPTTSGWLKFSKSWESIGNSDTNGHGFATSFGFDHSVGNSWLLGEFFSYGDNSFAGTNSSLKNKDYRLGIYGIREKGPSQIFLYFDAGRQNNDSKRYISAGANYMAESSYKSNTIELGGRYTYDTDYGKAQSWHRKPYGEVQVVHYNQDGYNETGAGVWNQSVGSGNSTYSSATVGFGLEKRMKNEEIEVHVGYKRVLSGSDPTYPVHWIDGGAEHVARGSGLDKNLMVVGVHAEQKQEDNWNLSGDIELEQGHSQQNVQASVMLKKIW